jgi:hypothetical protein
MTETIDLTEFRRNIVSSKSESNYLNSVSNFIMWCYENAIIIVQLELQNDLMTKKQSYDLQLANLSNIELESDRELQFSKIRSKYLVEQKRFIKQWVLNAQDTLPVHFDLITGDLFTTSRNVHIYNTSCSNQTFI